MSLVGGVSDSTGHTKTVANTESSSSSTGSMSGLEALLAGEVSLSTDTWLISLVVSSCKLQFYICYFSIDFDHLCFLIIFIGSMQVLNWLLTAKENKAFGMFH